MKKTMIACLCLGLFFLMSPQFSAAQETTDVIKLPPPQMTGGKPLMDCLKARQSTRGNFGPEEKLSLQTLSNLLWAADGVNRPNGLRTAPDAAGWHNMQLFVLTADGVFLYDPPQHVLKVITKQDMRANAGLEGSATGPMKQDFAKTAPVSLVYVSDYAKTMRGGKPTMWNNEDAGVIWSYADAGAIAENVYLFCASEGLACIVRAMIDAAKVSQVLKLGPEQKVLLTSTIAQFKK